MASMRTLRTIISAVDAAFAHFSGSTSPRPASRYYNINLACLEGIDIDELMAAPVTHEDGRNDRWEATPAETRHL